jgi:hypothetical protein
LLVVVGEMLLKAHEALAPGDVIRGAGDILDTGEKTALYAAAPTFLPDDFAVFVASEPPTEIVWLVPITGVRPISSTPMVETGSRADSCRRSPTSSISPGLPFPTIDR